MKINITMRRILIYKPSTELVISSIHCEGMNATTKTYSSNSTYVDPLGEAGKIIYPAIGTIMFLAIVFNITGVVLMLKSKELRKHSQNFIYMIISMTELFIDVFYLLMVFWKQRVLYVCGIFFFLYTVGRHNVIIHLIYLCVERFCAVNPSLHRTFQRMITIKSRLIFLGLSMVASCILVLPPIILYATPEPYDCGVAHIFAENTGFVLGINRTVFSIELLFIFTIYIYLVKKIKTINNSVHPITVVRTVEEHGTLSSLKENSRNPSTLITTTTLNSKPSEVLCNPDRSTGCSSQENDKYSQNRIQVSSIPKKSKWKLKAFKMLKCAILTTIIPSTPLIFIHILILIKPSLRNHFLDLIISLCNISHAIIYPLVFMITVKQCKCTKR